jgi:MFS family permease
MFAPGADQLAADFHITNQTVASLTVSIYVLGFAFGPLLVSPLSELYGRRVICHFCAVLYFAFTVACAFSTGTAMFLVFRFLAGCVASGPMTVGGGTVADVTSPEKRGLAMALFFIGPLLGPVSTPRCFSHRGLTGTDGLDRSPDPLLEVSLLRKLVGAGPFGLLLSW